MHQRQPQSGSVLIVSLLFLLVLTLIGITSMQGVSLEEKMAGNARGGTLAFQAAEAALRDGETWVMGIDLYDPPTPVDTCSTAPCALWETGKPESYPETKTMAWWQSNGREYGVAGTQELTTSAGDPRFLVEYLGYDPANSVLNSNERARRIGPHFYRATAAGFGPQASAQRVLQSTVRTWKN
ncbi:pilus assembly PilX family protein [Nitrococcus mobilis]|uniref:Type IV pilus assembly protein PilX n=1 Tax=Nitrococcus mobilis Nb-231 TaxID=314278 RepID=A4BTT6_9GAMM|nr:PilX N-terminal domain-containing pilus assembly protein [Nitrococcus mobilis]EAR20900.1 type IV pilus assembly protein PilX [Nitrococcus mobilis Nb-231]